MLEENYLFKCLSFSVSLVMFPKNSSSEDKFLYGHLPHRERAATGIAVIFTSGIEEIRDFESVSIS